MSHTITKIAAAWLSVGMLAASGCTSPDPDGRFQDFVDQTEDQRGPMDAGTIEGGQQVDFSGTYFLGLGSNLNTGDPFFFEATVTVDENFVFDLTLQPLTVDTAETPRVAVGDPILVEGVQLDEDGKFVADIGLVNLAGDANPVTGSEIVADIELQGTVFGPDQFCGTATGTIPEPLMGAPLEGGTFGVVPLEEDTVITDLEPVRECPDDLQPVDDAGMGDAGMEDAGDAGMVDDSFYRCPDVDFTGTWTFEFKSSLQGERASLILELVEDSDPTVCYTGDVFSGADGTTDLGDVERIVERDGQLVVRIPNFTIPPGANPALPDGGTSNITALTSGYTDDGACGNFDTVIDPIGLATSGTWSMLKDGAAGLSYDEDLAVSGCESIIRETTCAFADVAEEYTMQFQTSVQNSPTNVLVRLEANDLTCLNGVVESTDTPDFILSYIINAEDDGEGNLVLNGRNFFIPASSNPLGDDPLWADFPVTTEQLDPGVSMCGMMQFLIVSPPDFPLMMQSGGFAAGTAGNEPTMPGCP